MLHFIFTTVNEEYKWKKNNIIKKHEYVSKWYSCIFHATLLKRVQQALLAKFIEVFFCFRNEWIVQVCTVVSNETILVGTLMSKILNTYLSLTKLHLSCLQNPQSNTNFRIQ